MVRVDIERGMCHADVTSSQGCLQRSPSSAATRLAFSCVVLALLDLLPSCQTKAIDAGYDSFGFLTYPVPKWSGLTAHRVKQIRNNAGWLCRCDDREQ